MDSAAVAGRGQVGHRSAAPRRERHVGLLGQELGLDLVAEPPHHLGRRADEDDPEPVAQLGELGLLRDEPPAGPNRVRPAGAQRALQLGVVQVGAPGEGRVGFGLRPGPISTASSASRTNVACRSAAVYTAMTRSAGPSLGVPLPDGVDQPHGRLAPVDDRDTLEGEVGAAHRATHRTRRGCRRSCSRPRPPRADRCPGGRRAPPRPRRWPGRSASPRTRRRPRPRTRARTPAPVP